jgi:molybdopterin adenylyltransferase
MTHDDPVHTHRASAPTRVSCWALTISDTKTPETDRSGPRIQEALRAAGHAVLGASIVPDDPSAIRDAIEAAIKGGARAVVCTGGTGLTARDSTFEVVSALIDRPIPGFGELFRMLSYEEIKSAAMMSRAIAGVVRGTVVFALPGSTKAVALAMDKLIAPELGHIIEQLSR